MLSHEQFVQYRMFPSSFFFLQTSNYAEVTAQCQLIPWTISCNISVRRESRLSLCWPSCCCNSSFAGYRTATEPPVVAAYFQHARNENSFIAFVLIDGIDSASLIPWPESKFHRANAAVGIIQSHWNQNTAEWLWIGVGMTPNKPWLRRSHTAFFSWTDCRLKTEKRAETATHQTPDIFSGIWAAL